MHVEGILILAVQVRQENVTQANCNISKSEKNKHILLPLGYPVIDIRSPLEFLKNES